MEFTLVNKMVLLIAKRNSGKSVLLKHLVEDETDVFAKVFVVCPTEKINHFYTLAGITTQEYVYDQYSEAFVNKLLDRMAELNQGKPKDAMTKVLLILDDCIADVNFHSSPSLKRLFSTGRHYGCAVIFTSQYLNALSPLQRNNTDYILCGCMNNHSFDILCEEFLTGNITKQEFKKFYSDATKEYGFVVINNNSVKSGDMNEMYGSLRVPKEML